MNTLAVANPSPADSTSLEIFSRFGKSITIDHSRDELLTEFGKATLRDSYLLTGETYQELFGRVATRYGNDSDHAQRLYNYFSLLWAMPATPVLSNGGTDRGLPISCFLNEVEDSLKEIVNTWAENAWLAAMGGGLGSYWGNVREIGASCGLNGKTSGIVPFVKVNDSLTLAISQGSLRRGSAAVYIDINHAEIEEFLEIRKTSGDFNRKSLNLHHGILIPDAFMHAVRDDLEWALISRKTGEVVKHVHARTLFSKILDVRMATGEPYLIFIDAVNRALPAHQRALGLSVKLSNLCTEIFLATGLDHLNKRRTAVCCLSSTNHEKFEEWENDPYFIEDMVMFLDNVLQDFIDRAPTFIKSIKESLIEPVIAKLKERITDEAFLDEMREVIEGQLEALSSELPRKMEQAIYSATRERSIGLGNMGFHSFLQKKGILFESAMATSWNLRIHKHIKAKADEANRKLAIIRGACPDSQEAFERGFITQDELVRCSHVTATAPTASISIICGQTSACHETPVTNFYTHKTKSGSFSVFNRHLEKLLSEKGLLTEEVKASILANGGSVRHLGPLRDESLTAFNHHLSTVLNLLASHNVPGTDTSTVQAYIDQLSTALESMQADRSAQADSARGWADSKVPTLVSQLQELAADQGVSLNEVHDITTAIHTALSSQERAKIDSLIPAPSEREIFTAELLTKLTSSWAYLRSVIDNRLLDFDEVWPSLYSLKKYDNEFAILTEYEADLFKTSFEIDQFWNIQHMADRTPLIDQGASLNVFLPPDVHKYDLFMLHYKFWEKGGKSMYYLRSDSIAKTAVVGNVSADNTLEKKSVYAEAKKYDECAACQ